MLDGIAQGQGSGQGQSVPGAGVGGVGSNDIAGDIANQIAGGGSAGLNQILGGLDGQTQSFPKNQSASQEQSQAIAQGPNVPGNQNGVDISALTSGDAPGTGNNQIQGSGTGASDIKSSDIAGDIANQLAPGASAALAGAGLGENQNTGLAQGSGGNAQLIQVESTTITEPNGQVIATAIVLAGGQQAQAAAPAAITSQTAALPAEAKPTEPPSPVLDSTAEARSSMVVAESLTSNAENVPTERPAEGLNATVCILHDALYYCH